MDDGGGLEITGPASCSIPPDTSSEQSVSHSPARLYLVYHAVPPRPKKSMHILCTFLGI